MDKKAGVDYPRHSGPLSLKQKAGLRAKIASFCQSAQEGKNHQEVAAEFQISGISAAAFMSNLAIHGLLAYARETGRYKKA